MKNNTFAFYGSLRSEGYNAERMIRLFGKESYESVKKVKAKGWSLYDTGWGYPAISKSNNPDSEVVMEVFNISDRVAEYVHAMEIGAGYKEVTIMIDGEPQTIYVFDEVPNHFIEVPTGDWIDYLKQNKEELLKKY